ncbi:lamin tail domain-containing protein, partial [Patescibacteria group bacterium]|nr:lamin tail domain-containing protein [Patescibacteria group bacterium]
AKYSNNSFFSKDTIDNSIINKIQEYKTEKDFNGDDIVYGYYNGYRIIKTKKDLNKIKYQFDFRVHLDYWNMLHPKAVGYSAGTIDYFIKQFEQIDKEKQQQLSLKNKINKILTKTLSNVKYSWGDVFFTNLTKAEKIYSASKNITNNIKQNIGFFNQANKEIAEQGVKVITKIIQKTAENIINPPIKFEQLLKPLTAEESEDKKLNENIVKKVVNQKQIPILVESKGGLTNSAKLNAITIVELPKINNIIIEQEKISEQKEVEIFVKPKLSNFILVSNNNNIPPDTTIINSIDNISSSTSASFVFHSSEQDNTFECNLDEQGWHVCTQEYNLINLSENIHNLKVRAIDVNGNVDPISSVFNWTIDITAPTISIINHPAIFASSTTANFQFISDDDNTIYQYKLDNSDWQLCSASTSIADLIEGQHSLKIRGLDQMSNIGSSTIYTWLVDLTMPTSAIINMVATNDAINFNVNWNGEDINGVNAYDIQYKINNNDWQEWINNIISTSTIFNIAIVDEQTIYFRSRAKDNAGNIGEWSVIVQTKISNHIANHVVISEFATRGLTSATDEFIELYNPTDQIIDLTNWKLQFKPINEENWIDCVDGLGLSSSTAIAAKGYYLIVTVDYSLSTAPDYRHNINWELANNGGHIRILNSNNIEIDKVGYGLADNPETSAFIVDFSANTSLERKSFATSTAGTMDINGIHENSGNGYDSNNNSNDFIISNDPFPQSSNDSTEPLGDIELC